jgi:O-antigen ligase
MSIGFAKNKPKIILFLLLQVFLLPVVFNPFANIPFEVPKVKFLLVTTDLIATFLLFSLGKPNKKFDKKMLIFELMYLTAVFISSIRGANFFKSFWGNYWRVDGIFTLIHLIGISFIFSLFWKKSYNKYLATAISASAFIPSLIASYQKLIYPATAPASSFGNANFLAGYLLISLPFSLYKLNSSSRQKTFWLINFVLQNAAIVLTGSYSAIILLPIAITLWLFATSKSETLNIKFLSSLKIPLLLAVFILSISIYLKGYIAVRTEYRGYLPEGRERIYTNALLAIKQKPVFGWGWANFDYAFEEISWPMKWLHDVYVDKAHGLFLEIFSTAGIVGFTIFILICARTFINLAKHKNLFYKSVLLSFILYVIHSQTNIISINEDYLFWITVGIASGKRGKVLLGRKIRLNKNLNRQKYRH